jgi:hypothetical protein
MKEFYKHSPATEKWNMPEDGPQNGLRLRWRGINDGRHEEHRAENEVLHQVEIGGKQGKIVGPAGNSLRALRVLVGQKS